MNLRPLIGAKIVDAFGVRPRRDLPYFKEYYLLFDNGLVLLWQDYDSPSLYKILGLLTDKTTPLKAKRRLDFFYIKESKE